MGSFTGAIYLQLGIALLSIVAIVLGLAFLFHRSGFGIRLGYGRLRQRRLTMIEAMPLDNRRRLVLVRRDDVEHLLLLGPQTDLVVETAIAPLPQTPAPPDPRTRSAEPTFSTPPAALALQRKS